MADKQKNIEEIALSYGKLQQVILKHHAVCDWHEGTPVSFEIMSLTHWIVTYESGSHFHYNLKDCTWY